MWDLKSPPEAVLRNEHRLGSKAIEKAAAELAATFNVEAISAALSQSLATASGLADLRKRLVEAQQHGADLLGGMHLPHLPTRQEVFARACRMFAKTRSMDAIVERAHRMVLDAVGARLAIAS